MMLELLRKMVIGREIDEQTLVQKKKGNIPGALHPAIGQEAVSIGAGAALRDSDTITTTHRGITDYIGKGGDVRAVVCEVFGRANGCSKGRGGHYFVNDPKVGVLGGTGVVGGTMAMAAGHALAFQTLGDDRVALSHFGDGAVNTGMFHEALNLASIWKLPVIFLCQNNEWALTVHVSKHLSCEHVVDRAKGYGMPGVIVDGNDVMAVYEAVSQAASRARNGDGPSLIEAKTYRIPGFATSDVGGYRSEDEVERWKAKDPITMFESVLLKKKIADSKEIESVKAAAKKEVGEAVLFALESPHPDPSTVFDYLYA